MKNFDPKGGVCPCPVFMTTILKDFFSKTALPIKAKFYVEPPWEGERKFI